MRRKIIHINEELCDGCGVCAEACHEGAIEIVDGKAKLVKESYCDGLGDCIGPCPRNTITIEEREAEEYDAEAVKEHLETKSEKRVGGGCPPSGCPGTAMRSLETGIRREGDTDVTDSRSELASWPVQISLVPPNAPFLKGADLLLVADCVPFALPSMHQRFMRGRVTLVGCPKLDDADAHVRKLAAIFSGSPPRTITVLRMEVPCCGGLVRLVQMAMELAGVVAPLEVHTVGVRGDVTSEVTQQRA